MASFKSGSRWQFFCQFRKEWITCSAEEDEILKSAYLKCEEAPTHKYAVNNLKIKVDFTRMSRTNLASERSFDLKLTGGQLPFPPPGAASKKTRGTRMASSRALQKAEGESKAEVRETEQRETEQAAMSPDDDKNDYATIDALLRKSQEGMTVESKEKELKAAEQFDFVPNLSGKFEFTLNLEDKDDWGRVFLYKMFEAGIDPINLDPRFVVVTDKRGRSTSRNREEMREMMEVVRSYPVKVTYDPPEVLNPQKWGTQQEKCEWEFENILMHFIKASITGPNAPTMEEIKYRQHRCGFQRYQLYVGEADQWMPDNPMSEEEIFLKYPEMGPMVTLALVVGPRLQDVFRGKEEMLNLLFGG